MRLQGRISEWQDDRGFGFITPNGGGERVFLHIRSLAPGHARPRGGELVNYRIGRDARERIRAEQVEYVQLRRRRNPVRSSPRFLTSARLIVAISFPAALAALAIAGRVPLALPLACVLLSGLTYALYAIDKSAAREGRWRTQESTLQLFALLGGWPGALLAQQRLRHKSRKLSFQIVFWSMVALNIGAVLWLLGPNGAKFVAGSNVLAAPLLQARLRAHLRAHQAAGERDCDNGATSTIIDDGNSG